MKKQTVQPPKTWKNVENHYLKAIDNEWYLDLIEIENMINKYTTLFYSEKNIKTLHMPITTGSISSPMGLGSDSLPVKIKLHNIDTYLADSMQFSLEYATRLFKNGAYYIMPSFRGEKEDERHLSQFYHSEVEIAGTLEDVMQLAEEYIKYLSKNILREFGNELEKIAGDTEHIKKLIETKKFPVVTFEEACEILENSDRYIEYHEEGFRTINSLGEKELIKYFDGIVWLKNFDILSVPFYQNCTPDKKYAMNADLLFGIGETLGAGERHESGEEARQALKMHNVNENEYGWYIKMKDKYPLKTSGYGMGIERYILWLTKKDDIRDCQLLPRFNGEEIVV